MKNANLDIMGCKVQNISSGSLETSFLLLLDLKCSLAAQELEVLHKVRLMFYINSIRFHRVHFFGGMQWCLVEP